MTEQKRSTSGGVELTEALIAKLAEEAAGGYEIDHLRLRSRRGRPPLGEKPASVFQVRLESTLRAALERAADAEGTTPSEVARRALREHLGLGETDSDAPAGEELVTVHEFALSFTIIDCPDCGRERAAGIFCPKCGRSPDEDPHVGQRREIIGRATKRLAEELPEAGNELAFGDGLLDDLAEWLPSFMELCAGAATERDVSNDLFQIIDRLRGWERDLAVTPIYRPYVWFWRLVGDVIDQLKTIAQAYFDSLGSADPREVERLGGSAQEAIDRAATIAERANHLLDRWHRIEQAHDDDPMASLIAIAEAEASERTEDSPLASDPVAAALYERVTGDSNVPAWLGLGLRLADVQMDPLFDRGRFWDCAALTYRRVATKSSKGKAALAQAASSPNWIRDLHEVHDEMFEIGREIRAMAGELDRPKALARTLVRLGHQLAERCAPPLLASVIAAYRARSYDELRDRDIGSLLSEAGDVGLESLSFGIDQALRHADAHKKLFEITADGVNFSAENREYDHLTWDQLVDRVLGGWESVSALMTGILCAVEAAGVPVDDLDPLTHLDVPLESRLKFILAAIGWRDVTISRRGQDLLIQARSDHLPTRLGFLGYLAPYVEEGIRLKVTVEAEGEERSWAGSTDGLDAFRASTTDEQRQAAILWMLGTWTEDGEPLVSREQLRKLAAVQVMQWTAAQASFETRIQSVQSVQEAAAAAGDAELTEAISRVVEGLRLIAAGRSPRDWERTVDQLSKWGGVKVPTPAILGAEDSRHEEDSEAHDPEGDEMDDRFWEELRANAEIELRRSGKEGVRLRGGPMHGWLVSKDAPSLAPDWYKTWPPTVEAKQDSGRYELSESGTWAEWKSVEEDG